METHTKRQQTFYMPISFDGDEGNTTRQRGTFEEMRAQRETDGNGQPKMLGNPCIDDHGRKSLLKVYPVVQY